MNDSPGPGSWIRSIPSRRLAAFAVVAALYVALFSALFFRRVAEYFVEVARSFPFARPWIEWLVR